ncbi:Maf family protein [Arenibacterium halophilum]|uniref:Nucleoside triphosphate pyrophosphatase n=1 Tax=Arenibacterium halophilum TaxID=2583821 RepID=A0ABY2X6J4_9RHOB|nr:Maf family protein [Arenibacterium halophilum]TMV10747.1 septum formation protein Maf [Arenibacterium halophilum]
MAAHIVLASGSETRASMLRNAGLVFDIERPRVDEEAAKAGLLAEQARPRDIADALAEMKARKVSARHPGAMVIGSDQVLDFQGQLLSKPDGPDHAIEQLSALRGQRHSLYSAAVIVQDGAPIWRHVGQVRLQMRDVSDAYLSAYVARNWEDIRHSVGAYQLEREGIRLFTAIDGDYFTVLGMPLLQVLNFLALRGDIET